MEKVEYKAPKMEVYMMKPQNSLLVISDGNPNKDDNYEPGE